MAFFTSFTHSVLPYAEIARRAGLLAVIIPEFKALGIRVGINHLATLGHLDENLEHSLNEPWQKMTDIIVTISSDGDYTVLELPALAPWEMVLLEINQHR